MLSLRNKFNIKLLANLLQNNLPVSRHITRNSKRNHQFLCDSVNRNSGQFKVIQYLQRRFAANKSQGYQNDSDNLELSHKNDSENPTIEGLSQKKYPDHKYHLMSQQLGQEFDTIIFHEDHSNKICNLFKVSDDKISIKKFLQSLSESGLTMDDPRLKETFDTLKQLSDEQLGERKIQNIMEIDKKSFMAAIRSNIVLINSALQQEFVIPNFKDFTNIIEQLYLKCKENKSGRVADYIPQLAKFSPDLWGVSICTVDGQVYSIGDTQVDFTIQSAGKSLNYAVALSEVGESVVHKYVGQEPSGRMFNEIVLDHENKPHNPMINAGAIIISSILLSVVEPTMKISEKFDWMCNKYEKMAGNRRLRFNNATFLSEKEAAHRNYAIGYYLQEHKCYPPELLDHQDALDFYFQLCSLEMNSDAMAIIASTLANGGICPLTGQQVISSSAVRNVLSLMHSCGMYDYSGQFAFTVGLPAKSGVSGCLMLIVPNCLGIGLYSPPLDVFGNSVRGVQFCIELVKTFNFHHYDNLRHTAKKLDPRIENYERKCVNIAGLLLAAANGDVNAMRRYFLSGVNMSQADYDKRTALHLAASEGHIDAVDFLLNTCKVDPNVKDRWGHTPIEEAQFFGHPGVVNIIQNNTEKTNRYLQIADSTELPEKK